MTRFFCGFAAVLAIVVSAVGVSILTDPEHARPPHAAPPAAEASAPLPLAVVGGDSTAALEREYRAFIEGVQREQDRIAAEEAERARRDAQARASAGSPRGGGGGGCPHDDEWECLRWCESGGNYSTNTGNNYYGAYQFLPSTWRGAVSAAGHAEYADTLPSDAPPEVQDAAARHLQSVRGWQPWPGCRAKLGLR